MKLINLVPFKEAANAAQQAAIAINMKKKGIKPKDEAKGPCWQGYKQVGMKGKGGKQVPNCVPISESEINENLDALGLLIPALGALIGGGLAQLYPYFTGHPNIYTNIKDWWKSKKDNSEMNKIANRIKNDPEVQEFLKKKNKSGWQEMLKKKLSGSELNYLNKIYRSRFNNESINEATGREAKEIAKLTGTRDSIVQKFIDDFNLNAKNLFNFIAKGKEKVRKDFATAMSGRPGNKYQGDFVGMFGESEVSATGQPGGYFKEETCPDCGKKMEQCECGMYEGNDDDYDELDVEPEEIDDFIDFLKAYKNTLDEGGCPCLYEAEYQGRDVKLGHPMQGDVKKFKVYVKNPAGNVVKVNFGQKGMKIRKSNPAARKSFRARMNCDNPGPRTKANYWSCRKW